MSSADRTTMGETEWTAGKGGRTEQQTLNIWEWLLLYGTGALLLVFLLGHIWLVHYAETQLIRFSTVFQRLRLVSIQVLDLSLLFFALVHGLVGVRRVVVDMEVLGQRGLRLLTVVLTLLGLGGLFIGIQIFRAFT